MSTSILLEDFARCNLLHVISVPESSAMSAHPRRAEWPLYSSISLYRSRDYLCYTIVVSYQQITRDFIFLFDSSCILPVSLPSRKSRRAYVTVLAEAH